VSVVNLLIYFNAKIEKKRRRRKEERKTEKRAEEKRSRGELENGSRGEGFSKFNPPAGGQITNDKLQMTKKMVSGRVVKWLRGHR